MCQEETFWGEGSVLGEMIGRVICARRGHFRGRRLVLGGVIYFWGVFCAGGIWGERGFELGEEMGRGQRFVLIGGISTGGRFVQGAGGI